MEQAARAEEEARAAESKAKQGQAKDSAERQAAERAAVSLRKRQEAEAARLVEAVPSFPASGPRSKAPGACPKLRMVPLSFPQAAIRAALQRRKEQAKERAAAAQRRKQEAEAATREVRARRPLAHSHPRRGSQRL